LPPPASEEPHDDQVLGWSKSAWDGAIQAMLARETNPETGLPYFFEELSDPEVMKAAKSRFLNPHGM
jgi:hypothetical protein